MSTRFTLNGKSVSVDVDPSTPLLWTLRDELGMTGSKFGCGIAACGACTVHLNGSPTRSCVLPVSAVAGQKVTTIEAVGADKVGQAVQAAWAEARKTLALLGLTLALVTPEASQGEVAVPFLMISPSQESNGMGETSIAVRRYDPTASILSPAQLGLSALSTNVRTGFYLCPARSLTAFNLPGLTYTAWAASVGVSLNDFIELAFKLGVGLAYHKVDFDLGQFVITGMEGQGRP